MENNFEPKKDFRSAWDLLRQIRPLIKHRDQNPLDFEFRVPLPANLTDCLHKFGDALQGKIFTLNRYEDAVGSHQSVDGEKGPAMGGSRSR